MYCSINNVAKSNLSFRYNRGTVRLTMSVKILSTAVQLYEKSHFERPALGHDLEGHSRSSELPRFNRKYRTFY